MATDVRGRFLDDPVHRLLDVRIQSCGRSPRLVGEVEVERDVDVEHFQHPLDERLQGRAQAERVERRGSHVRDQVAQRADGGVDALRRLVEHLAPGRLVRRPRRREQHLERGQRLERLVVELARPPPPLSFLRLDPLAKRSGGGDLRGRHPRGRADRERLEEALVPGRERRVVAPAVECGQHAERPPPHGERDEEAGRRPEAVGQRELELGGRLREPLRPAGAQDVARNRSFDRDPHPEQVLADVARQRRDDEVPPVIQHDQHQPGVGQHPSALHDELEDAVEVGLPGQRECDVVRRLGDRDGVLQLLPPALDEPVGPGIRDRDRGPVGEDDDRLLVVLVEVAAFLLGQVDVPEGLPADDDRRAQEAAHRRVPGGKAVRLRMGADILDPDRPRILDQQAEHAASPRQVADRLPCLVVDADRQEALELAPALVEHSEGGVARSGQLPGSFEDGL